MGENCAQLRFLRYILIHKCNKFIFKFAKQLILTESESLLNFKDLYTCTRAASPPKKAQQGVHCNWLKYELLKLLTYLLDIFKNPFVWQWYQKNSNLNRIIIKYLLHIQRKELIHVPVQKTSETLTHGLWLCFLYYL